MHASLGLAQVPPDFSEELDRAASAGWRGRVALLGYECQGAAWELEGLRLVGRRQFAANSLEAAAVTFEELRARLPSDPEANLRLAAIWQRLGDPQKSAGARRRLREESAEPGGAEPIDQSIARLIATLPPAAAPRPETPAPRTLLFTGHRIDAPDRAQPRFPADKEPGARAAIRAVVSREAADRSGAIGIAGAASGGDILFHEVCEEIGVPTRLFLALPPDRYIARSVAEAGEGWVRRFWAIYERHPRPPLLSETEQNPGWLRHREPYPIWQRNNLWMLNEALAAGARSMTIVALWNGKTGDGPGGTADMIEIAGRRGADIRIIDIAAL